MSFFWKFLGIFAIIWLIWYWTGGPQRATNVKPYLQYNYDNTKIYKSEADLETGGKELLPINTIENGATVQGELQNNLNNSQFIQPQ